MENREGQQVPVVTFKTRTNEGWLDVSSDELFKSRNVIVFSLPGAFTPTCSATHLPRYEELASVFKAEGIDEIICIAVNDGFIMHAWANDQALRNVRLLPDGNGEFTNGMGLLVEKKELGFGKRSWRYSMLVKNCVIEKMFIEEEKPGDPFGVSDADTMLNFINPEAKAPVSITILSKSSCPFCKKTKEMLDAKGMAYEEILIGEAATHISTRALSGSAGVPQIFIDGKLIGGSSELQKYLK